ncbi:MAG: T9SS type A sorting domain-containing protein [Lentimicrobiaceae bacterium]|nr:T9SS type A sorting domain-containing protein [Lentimicrobiaceae bacterium]
MKTKFYYLLIAILALSFTASAQKFGSDVVLHECSGDYRIQPKISVADNGWIYVLMNKYDHPTEKDETRIYRSKDGGANFEQIYHGITPTGIKQGGRDFVVTGSNESDINIWYLYADNNMTIQKTSLYLVKMDADAKNGSTIYSFSYENTKTKDVAIATNARSPEFVFTPFIIGFAFTNHSIDVDRGNVEYCYSMDGGATFDKKWIYNKVGSSFGSIDISIGQADENLYMPRVGIVFEMDIHTENNIGFIAGYAYGGDMTDVLQVNKKYSTTFSSYEPKIQWLCNNTLDELNNFMIAYTCQYSSIDWDIMKIFPKPSYDIYNHTLDNLDWAHVASAPDKIEVTPDLSYDKKYNNYLLAYVEKNDDEYTLKYKVQHYTKIDQGPSGWVHVGDVSLSSLGNGYFYFPAVDIDLTRSKACIAFEYHNSASPKVTKLLFDSEWSTLDSEKIFSSNGELNVFPNPATNTINIKLQDSDKYSAKIIDFQGKLIKKVCFAGNQTKISLENMPAGIYMLKINSGKKQYTEKFIKL